MSQRSVSQGSVSQGNELEPLVPEQRSHDDGRSVDAIEDRDQDLEQLREALARARASEAELVEEFTNYRRRAEAELSQARTRAQRDLLGELADTVMALEAATAATEADAEAVREGVALVSRGLERVFEAHGLTRITTTGAAFDPVVHEAVLTEQVEGVERGTVVRELSPGFRTEERVVRPSRVSVAA